MDKEDVSWSEFEHIKEIIYEASFSRDWDGAAESILEKLGFCRATPEKGVGKVDKRWFTWKDYR